MKTIRDFAGQELTWEQPKLLKMEYELRSGTELLATLRFRSSLGSFATAQFGESCWTFKRVGFFKTKVTIRLCDSENEIAVFNKDTWSGGGSLDFVDGRQFFASTNFWQTRYEFTTPEEEVLVRFKQHAGLKESLQCRDLISSCSTGRDPLLICLGWYLAVLLYMDSVRGGCDLKKPLKR
jgi:hypothetical protein